MWATFREINSRLWSLRALRAHVELEEGTAYAASLRAEAKMRVLGGEIQDLDLEFAEANEWLRSVLRSGESGPMYERLLENAREMLRRVHHDVVRVCEEARILNDTRNRLCDEEECMEMGGYSLSSAIEKLKCDLADVLAAGCTND